MKKFIEWQENIIFWWMAKFDLGVLGLSWISWIKGFIMGSLLLLLCGCSSYKLALLNHNDPVYPVDYVIPIAEDTKIDTIDSFSELRWKLRTDFSFRWDFAQYAMNQPYSWYWNNPRLDGIWRPYNRFDVYFYSNWFWTDWAWNYPFNYHSWGWYNWNRPYYYYGWNRPYRPWNNINWNTNYDNNIVYVSGRRGSRNIISNNNNNIENNIVRRYNNPRKNVDNSNLNNIVNTLRENYNIKPRVYDNPNNVPNNNRIIINNNNTKPSWNNTKPTYNNNYNFNSNSSTRSSRSFSPPPSSSNISRGSSTSSGGSSRGGNSRGRN